MLTLNRLLTLRKTLDLNGCPSHDHPLDHFGVNGGFFRVGAIDISRSSELFSSRKVIFLTILPGDVSVFPFP